MTETIDPADTPPIGRARTALFRRLIDIVALPASRLAHQDRSMAADILLDMLFHADTESRQLCARRLRDSREAPRRLLRYLGQCSFEVAGLVLQHCPAYDAVDLREIAEIGTAEHRLAIASRKTVPPVVTDYLSEFAEMHVVKALLDNRGTEISEISVDKLVVRSRQMPELCTALMERLETQPSHGMTMFWWADGITRRKILQRHAADRLEVIEMCAEVFPMAVEEKWADPVARKALQLIERRQRNRAAIDKSPYDSLEDAVNAGVTEGLTNELVQEIGYLAGVKPVTIAKIMSDDGGEGLAVLCKATGLHRDFLKVLWAALKRPFRMDEGDIHPQFHLVSETYEMLTVAKAQTTLRYWNWSLSSAIPTSGLKNLRSDDQIANDTAQYSAAQRTASLVFGD
jgi:uncharacterized protein (DUF2336 family)